MYKVSVTVNKVLHYMTESFIRKVIWAISAWLAADLQSSSKHDANSPDFSPSGDTLKVWFRQKWVPHLASQLLKRRQLCRLKSQFYYQKHFTFTKLNKPFSWSNIRVCSLFQTPQSWENISQAPHSWNTEEHFFTVKNALFVDDTCALVFKEIVAVFNSIFRCANPP